MDIFTYDYCFGPGLIVMDGFRVKRHLWGRPRAELLAEAGQIDGGGSIKAAPRRLELALAAYFQGRPADFSLWEPLWQDFSAFAAAVYRQTRRLKWGETVTYSDIAAAIGRPGAARAVGGALGRNPAPLFIPCHRVLASRGEGGWSGPPGLKGKLLNLERRSVRYEVYS